MHDGTCDRCGATAVRAAANSLASQSTHTTMWPHGAGQRKGIVRANQAEVWQYVCTNCGVMEWRIHDPSTLAWIAENWVAVTPPERPEPDASPR